MSFKLSKGNNADRMFVANWSELTNRFDPEMVRYRRRAHSFQFPLRSIRSLLCEVPQYGAGERGLDRTDTNEPRYVRITDIDEFGVLSHDLGATAAVAEAQYFLNDGDLLLARSGNTVGKAYLHKTSIIPYACFFAGYLIRFRFDRHLVFPDYVFAYTQLPVFKEWVKAVQRRAGQPNINAEEYSQLKIALPPQAIQRDIVDRLDEAKIAKRSSDAQARQLLSSIDDLLLAELGIALPPELSATLPHRVFTRPFSELTGTRWDPLFFHRDIYDFIRTPEIALRPLRDFVTRLGTGFAAGKDDQADEDDGVVQIRPTNMSDDRELIFSRNVYIDRRELIEHPLDVLQRREVLFNNTNSQELVGKTVFFDIPGDFFASNHITRIATRETELHPEFLTHLLNLYQRKRVFFRLCTNWNNQSGVGPDVLGKVLIPFIPMNDQQRIVEKISAKRDEATLLRAAAAAQLAAAKREIEAMILGAD